jgi:hypothetical protein
MKSPALASFAALLAFSQASPAAVTGNSPPSPFTTWTPVVDNGPSTIPHGPGPSSPAPLPHLFRNFDAPVMDQYSLNVAFKARLRLIGTVTPANDEGVWSTGNFTSPDSLVLREGDPTGGGSGLTFGFGTSLQIQNLQMAQLGRTICQANTSHSSGTGKTIILDGAFGVGAVQQNLMESPTAVWKDMRPPVINQFLNAGHVDMWAQRPSTPPTSGVAHRSFAFNSNNPASFYAGLGWPFASGFAAGWHVTQPPRIGSPSIDYYANTAVFCRDTAGPSPRHIDLVDEFGVHALVARQNNLGLNANPTTSSYAPAAATFGVFHTRLMSNCGPAFGTSFPMVAWQMSNMLTGGGATASLWCQQGPVNNCLAFVTQTDPHTIESFTAFHALHAVPNPDSSKINSHYVFFGADLTGGFYGIYRCEIHGGIVTNFDLLATNKPGITPVNNPIGGICNIVSYSKFFSVNSRGTVFFRAKTTAPAASDVSLITAEPGTSNHSLVVRAQKGQTFTSASYTGLVSTEFQLAAPEQGTWSRGQAISNRGVAIKVILTPPTSQAIFTAF